MFREITRALVLTAIASASLVAQAPRPNPREWSSGGPLIPEQAAFDVTFYDLELRVSPRDSTIDGALTMFARATQDLEVIVLDLDTALTVRTVTSARPGSGDAGNRLTYDRNGGRIRIRLDDRARQGTLVGVRVAYGGRPRIAPRPPWIGGFQWARTPSGAPWIATTCVNEGADLWWPVKDHPSDKPDSMSLHITVPRGLIAASNGRARGSRDNADSTSTFDWHISTPISMYNVALNIAPYRAITRDYRSITGETIPVTLWVIPEHATQGEALANEMLEHLRFFESRLGPYPFRADKYGVAETPHLGMEHQTIIAYGNEFRKNADGYDELHQHELSHEWFANLITAKDWSDYWLHEGFGSYMQPLYAETLHGRDAYLRAIRAQWRGAKNRRPVAEPCCLTAGEVYFNPPDYLQGDGDIYGKGSVVLHTLRYVLGDSLFFRTIRRWLYPTPESERVTDGRQVRLVTTDEFVQHASRMAGRDLRWFFEVYVRQPALPRLVEERTDSTLTLRWETPGQLPFPMPIDVEVDGVVQRWEMRGRSETRSVARRATVRVDPGEWVFRRLTTPGA